MNYAFVIPCTIPVVPKIVKSTLLKRIYESISFFRESILLCNFFVF